MNKRTPDPVQKLLEDTLLDRPPSPLPAAAAPEQTATVIPIDDEHPLAPIMDAAARQAREQDGHSS